jgi:hypothetical protein
VCVYNPFSGGLGLLELAGGECKERKGGELNLIRHTSREEDTLRVNR